MSDTFKSEFEFHAESRLRDAEGRVLLSVDSIQQHVKPHGHEIAWQVAAEQQVSRTLTCDQGVCFIRNVSPEIVLLQIFQAVGRAREFCVVPVNHELPVTAESPVSQAHDLESRTLSHREPATERQGWFHCLSSGTSGTARRIVRSHRSWIRSFEINAEMFQLGRGDNYAIVGSLSHSLPLYASLEACHLGADLYLMNGLRPDRQLAALHAQGITVLYLTPAQARLMCRARVDAHQQITCLRYLLCGGGKLDEATKRKLKELFINADIIEFYGASETSFIAISNEQTPKGSVGRSYPDVSLKVLDENGEHTTGTGEIWVSSPYLFSAYSQGASSDTRQQGTYLSIGELGRLDDDGFLFLHGRKSRQANVADTSVFLEEVESVLLQHESLDHCVVLTQGDELRGTILLAVVQGRADEGWRRELLRFARQHLGSTLAPRDIRFIDSMPYLDSGKPDVMKIQSMVDSL